jgi:parallel beta-helix repeat protein
MIRKGIVICFILVLLTATIVITVPNNVSAASNWHVNGLTGVDVPAGGTPANPWLTIGYALAQGKVVNDDTILVAAATYSEKLTIGKSISLIGAGYSTTTIDGGGLPKSHTIVVTANNVFIEGFHIKNAHWSGITLQGTPASKITECTITENKISNNHNSAGIYLVDAGTISAENTIQNNIIFDNDVYGIRLHDSNYNIIDSNEIYDNNPFGGLFGEGIHLDDADNNIIKTNTIYNTGPGTQDIGISVVKDIGGGTSINNEIIENNHIYDMAKYGIRIDGCNDNEINDNQIEDNLEYGIFINNCNSNEINDNEIQHNTIYGIYLNDAGITSISSNDDDLDEPTDGLAGIHNNGKDGIYLLSSDFNTIEGNEIFDNDGNSDNSGDGIRLWSSDDNEIEGNEIYNTLDPVFGDPVGNQQYGIYLKQSYDNEIINNNVDLTDPADDLEGIHHNILDGIHLYNCQDIDDTEVNEIRANKINKNFENGIYLDISHKVKIIKDSSTSTMNEIFDNEENGILLDNSDSNTIEENEIYNTEDGNQQNGIYLYRSDSNWYINKNDIYENNEDGILLENSKDNILEENEIYNNDFGNQQNGIHVKAEFSAPSTYLPSILNRIQNLNNIYTNEKNGIFIEKCVDPTQQIVNWVENNIIHSNKEDGIYLKESDSHWIEGNEIYEIYDGTVENQQNGIHLLDSNDNFILNHNQDLNNDYFFGIHFNLENGIYLDSSDGNIVEGNNIHQNGNWGTSGPAGIWVKSSSDNSLNENVIWHQAWGIYLQSNSDSNTMLRCRIEDNYNWGIAIVDTNCNDNEIYHNTFYANNPDADPKPEGPGQALDYGSNTWDDGYPTGFDEFGNPTNGGGNSWNDWTIPDGFSGPNQNIPGGDTIVDLGEPGGGLNPYTIYRDDEGDIGEDRYPIVHELTFPSWW